jgi:DNA (cytosine-5)-methyltransferase 1
LAAVIPMERNTVPMRAGEEAVHTVKAGGQHHGLVMPYHRTAIGVDAAHEAAPTATTKERLSLIVPRKESELTPQAPREWSDAEIGTCRFRMFDLGEIARVMAMEDHPSSGGRYEVTGNKRERMAQYGNAVTPPVMELLVGRVARALDEKGAA